MTIKDTEGSGGEEEEELEDNEEEGEEEDEDDEDDDGGSEVYDEDQDDFQVKKNCYRSRGNNLNSITKLLFIIYVCTLYIVQ